MSIDALRTTGELSDVTVRVKYHDVDSNRIIGQQDMALHSTLLAAKSDWFRDHIFRNADGVTASMRMSVQSLVRSIYGGFLEKSLSVIEVHLPHSQKLYFEAMIVFMYNNSVDLNEQTYAGLLEVAHTFRVRELVDAVVDFILARLTWDNCVEAWLNAIEVEHPRYEAQTMAVVARNFDRVYRAPELGDAVPGKVLELLRHPDLNAAGEDVVFEMVRGYMQNIASRHGYQISREENRQLWGAVRLHYLPRPMLADLADHKDVTVPPDLVTRALIVRHKLEENPEMMGRRELAPRQSYRRLDIARAKLPSAHHPSHNYAWHADDLPMGWWHPGHRQYRAEIYAARNTLECECCREFRKRPATLAKPNTFQPTPRSPSAPPRTCCGLFRRPTPASQTFRDNHDSLGFVRQSGDGARSSASGSGWRTPRGVRKLPEYGVQGSGVSGTSANGREASGAWRRAGGDGGVVRGSGAVGNSGAWRAADRYRYPQDTPSVGASAASRPWQR